MSKYFGTDGFRGEAGVVLTADHAYKIGRILGKLACDKKDGRGAIVIGRDTRRSGTMLEQALAGGITASGADVYLLGVVTTPGVAFITRSNALDFDFGIMISASHNPYYDNGIKVLNCNGEKLEDSVITIIESYMDGLMGELPFAKGAGIGIVSPLIAAVHDYAEYLVSLASGQTGAAPEGKPFAGYRVALDMANGSSSGWASYIFEKLGADVVAKSDEPDGLNINVNCGSTHMGDLQDFVVANHCDLGFAYDGDADRCLAVDGSGNIVDGDQLMYMNAIYMKEKGELDNNTVVTTVMSNFGLYKALDAAGISYEKTAVGDKYVYENMAANGHMIGGEQSGHIIFRQYATTGDGMLTSLMTMRTIIASGKTLAQLVAPMKVFPQVLKNIRVQSKEFALADPDVQAAIEAADLALKGDGRVLVRKSGTEPVIRVMAEASTKEACETQVDAIIAVFKDKGHLV